MTSALGGAGPPLSIVGSVARLLGSELRSERTLAEVVDTLRRQLPARSVALWVREPNATRFMRISAPPDGDGPAGVETLELLPLPGAGVTRIPLAHADEQLGVLEIQADAGLDPLALAMVGDVIAPLLSFIELSEDLAHEVIARSREIDSHRLLTGLVIDSLPLGLYVVDRDYRIREWNRQREARTQGLRREDVVGRTVFEVLTRQPAHQLRAEFDGIFDTGEVRQTESEVTLDGETRFYRITKLPMRLGGDAITHVVAISEDITERRAMQERGTQGEKLAAIGQLAAGVMHEINNPLATIGACVAAIEGSLKQADGGAAVREYLRIVEQEVHRCTRIVDGLLDFSRSKGKTKSAVDLNTVVDDTLFLLKHHRRFKHLDVRRELQAELPRVSANAEQLVQVLMALLLNAIDAMHDGGRLTVRTTHGGAAAGDVVVEVEDTGTGIPRSEQAKIFEPFYTTKETGRGTGLGLSICYGIVSEHHGRLEVESQVGRGSIFRVILPRDPAP